MMRNLSLLLSRIVGVLIVCIINPVYADLFVSGDGNITNPLTGAWMGYVDVGNQQFFSNVLRTGSTVAILNADIAEGGSGDYFISDIDTYYNSLSGVISFVFSGTVTSAQLSGVDLFVVVLPDDDFTTSEIDVMTHFLAGGGSIFFLGENSNVPHYNSRINGALDGLGSSLRIINDLFDSGFHTATGTQIASDPYTANVSTFTYAAPSEVSVVSGGTPLFYGTNGTIFLAYETTSVPVNIDIKPGSYPNSINLGNEGVIPVAILSSSEFDATTVDPATVELAGAGVELRGKSDNAMAHREDVNKDGRIDLVVQITTQNLDPGAFQDGYATLTGKTYDGLFIEGADEITIVPK